MAKVAVITLGCSKNEVDSEYMLGVLEQSGHELVTGHNEAEVVIVNTCSFITAAKREALTTILEVGNGQEGSRPYIIVAGCLAQQHYRELFEELPEVGAFIGPGAIPRLPQIVDRVLRGERLADVPSPLEENLKGLPRLRLEWGPTAYLKIAEGCNNGCTYCTIPQIKGPYRSRPQEEVLAEAKFLISRGVRELVLVAQDTTAYGRDLYGRYALTDLLQALARLLEIRWIRLLYAHPLRISPELVEVMAGEEKICSYLDLPLQHAHPEILQAMGRGHTREQAVKTIARLRSNLPDLALRSTFMVGFPGEKERHFRELLHFLEEVRFDWVGVFVFSPEEGTPAAAMPGQVAENIKQRRHERLLRLQEGITWEKNLAWVGREVEVLVEKRVGSEPGQDLFVGRSFRQAPEVDGVIYIKGSCRPGQMARVKLTEVQDVYDLVGEVLS